jgi:hypothetical protein
MNLENRLNHLELKIRATILVVEVSFNTDNCIKKLGLDPTGIRESVCGTRSSLAEAISAALGIEPREFARQIKVRANCGR